MCRTDDTTLDATPKAARAARRFVAEACARWELDELLEPVQLAVSELVTNAVVHARTPLRVSLAVAQGVLEVSVHDQDPRPPVLRPLQPELLAQLAGGEGVAPRHNGALAGGRGLVIVDAIADEWGVSERAGGKDVWFSASVPAGWPHLDACTCPPRDRPNGQQAVTARGERVSHLPGPWDRPGDRPAGR